MGCSKDPNPGKKSVIVWVFELFSFRFILGFIIFWKISQCYMYLFVQAHHYWEYWLNLLMFMKNVTTCGLDLLLFMGILLVMVIVSHYGPYKSVGF